MTVDLKLRAGGLLSPKYTKTELETLAEELNPEENNNEDAPTSDKNGGGCDTVGFGALALAGLIPLLGKKQK